MGDGLAHVIPVGNLRGGEINVCDYGAVPNNAGFDNYAAFAAAFATGAKTIFIPEGTYYFSTKDAVNDCLWYINRKANIVGYGATLKTTITVGSIVKMNTFSDVGYVPHKISGLTLYCAVSGSTYLANNGLWVFQDTNFAIEDVCVIGGVTAGIRMGSDGDTFSNSGVWVGSIRNCRVNGFSGNLVGIGIWLALQCTQVTIDACYMLYCGFGLEANGAVYCSINAVSEYCTCAFNFQFTTACEYKLAAENCQRGMDAQGMGGTISHVYFVAMGNASSPTPYVILFYGNTASLFWTGAHYLNYVPGGYTLRIKVQDAGAYKFVDIGGLQAQFDVGGTIPTWL